VKVAEVVRLLRDDGWFLVATRGSHHQYKHPIKPGRVTVPGKLSDDLAPGTLNSILKQAGLKPRPCLSLPMRYAVVIEKARGNYSGYVPDLPGCVATGKTPAVVRRELRKAIHFHLDGLREDGLSIPRPAAKAEYVVAK
jgi:predicted RNA binding protein YcfA (HicA-like mRNA interferase family)/predicted RNase H-like HicB family nuclease